MWQNIYHREYPALNTSYGIRMQAEDMKRGRKALDHQTILQAWQRKGNRERSVTDSFCQRKGIVSLFILKAINTPKEFSSGHGKILHKLHLRENKSTEKNPPDIYQKDPNQITDSYFSFSRKISFSLFSRGHSSPLSIFFIASTSWDENVFE